MSQHRVEDIRNIVVCGHGSAGKTTLVDRLLQKTGAVPAAGSIDQGTSVCDFDDEEKHHKYSIESTIVHFTHAGKQFNVIDTPGYPDFIGQAIGAMRAVETALICINAHSGIAVNTRRVFQEAGAAGLGRIIAITKLDTENIEFPKLLGQIKELFGPACVPLNVPIGVGHDVKGVVSTLKPPGAGTGAIVDPAGIHTTLIETIVEIDDEVMARYFEGTPPTDEEFHRLIVEAVAQGKLIPIVCLAAKSDIGLPELLDAIALCALPPGRKPCIATKEDGTETTVLPDPNGPLVAQVFKTRIDPFVQKVSYFRVFSGKLKKDDSLHVSSSRKNIKAPPLFRIQANKTEPIESAGPGDIVAFTKTDELHTGVSIGPWTLPPIKFPTPMASLAVAPKSRNDEAKLSGALHKIAEEDPTIILDRDSQTKELVMTGMSELHLQIIRERLKRRDKVEVDVRVPKIPYRETIQAKAEGSYRHKKQSGGRGQFGEVHIRMLPFPLGTDPATWAVKERFPSMREYKYDEKHNFVWIDSIVGGTIPNNFLPAVEKGFKERMERGVLAGFKIQNLAVEVHFGKYHDVDSSEAAFKTAGSMAFRNVFQLAKPALLEPIVHLHITVPGDKLGDISSDMSGRRGRVAGMTSAGGDLQTVHAVVPLAEVTTYARTLSSITGGQGSFSMELSHYDVVPGNVQKEIVDKAVMAPEEDE